ncbi:MAG: hypothetical protein HQ475_10810 [SAR202 cluster bacterium]|nr:hypothetical protein [SAR202 cluster bacterium]
MNKINKYTPQTVRLALVYEAVNYLNDTGKIKLQKLMYFLQESFRAPTDYSFRMHHYGPYSEELDADLSRLGSSGYLSIKPDVQGYGFHVSVEDGPDESWSEISAPYKKGLERIIELFGNKQTPDLELMATLHFANEISNHPPKEELIKIVQGLKPKFSEAVIEKWRSELEGIGLLTHD